MTNKKPKAMIPIIIGVMTVGIVFMFSNTLFLPALFHMYRLESEGQSGKIITDLSYGLGGYTVTISGKGEMSSFTPAEWQSSFKTVSAGWKVPIKRAIVQEGITSLSSGLFDGCSKLREAELPESLKTIGVKAFAYCHSLNQIRFSGTVGQWNTISENSPDWNAESRVSEIICSDGTVELSE